MWVVFVLVAPIPQFEYYTTLKQSCRSHVSPAAQFNEFNNLILLHGSLKKIFSSRLLSHQSINSMRETIIIIIFLGVKEYASIAVMAISQLLTGTMWAAMWELLWLAFVTLKLLYMMRSEVSIVSQVEWLWWWHGWLWPRKERVHCQPWLDDWRESSAHAPDALHNSI